MQFDNLLNATHYRSVTIFTETSTVSTAVSTDRCAAKSEFTNVDFKLSGDYSAIGSNIGDATVKVRAWLAEMMTIDENRIDGLTLTPGSRNNKTILLTNIVKAF